MLGTMAAMTPMGTPISHSLFSGISRRMPLVFMGAMAESTVLQAKRFFSVLSWVLPKPVSSTAILARAAHSGSKAAAMAATMASSAPWSSLFRRSWAAPACRASSRASCRAARSISNCGIEPQTSFSYNRREPSPALFVRWPFSQKPIFSSHRWNSGMAVLPVISRRAAVSRKPVVW